MTLGQWGTWLRTIALATGMSPRAIGDLPVTEVAAWVRKRARS